MAENTACGKTAVADLDVGSEDIDQPFCDPCGVDGSLKVAEGFCKTCMEYLCISCYKYHCKPKPMRHHVLIDAESMPMTRFVIVKREELDEKCLKHSQMPLKIFCKSHDDFGCIVCLSEDHNDCGDVSFIQDCAKGVCNTNEYLDFKSDFEKLRDSLKAECEVAETRVKRVEEMYAKLDTSEAVSCLTRLLDNVKDFENKKSELMLNSVSQRCSQSLTELEKYLADDSSDAQKFINMKRGQILIKQFKFCLENMKTINKSGINVHIDIQHCKSLLQNVNNYFEIQPNEFVHSYSINNPDGNTIVRDSVDNYDRKAYTSNESDTQQRSHTRLVNDSVNKEDSKATHTYEPVNGDQFQAQPAHKPANSQESTAQTSNDSCSSNGNQAQPSYEHVNFHESQSQPSDERVESQRVDSEDSQSQPSNELVNSGENKTQPSNEPFINPERQAQTSNEPVSSTESQTKSFNEPFNGQKSQTKPVNEPAVNSQKGLPSNEPVNGQESETLPSNKPLDGQESKIQPSYKPVNGQEIETQPSKKTVKTKENQDQPVNEPLNGQEKRAHPSNEPVNNNRSKTHTENAPEIRKEFQTLLSNNYFKSEECHAQKANELVNSKENRAQPDDVPVNSEESKYQKAASNTENLVTSELANNTERQVYQSNKSTDKQESDAQPANESVSNQGSHTNEPVNSQTQSKVDQTNNQPANKSVKNKKSQTQIAKEVTDIEVISMLTLTIKKRDNLKCRITGSTVLADGGLALADYSNEALKVLYPSLGHKLIRKKCSSKPFDVTELYPEMIAVSLPSEKTIALYMLDDEKLTYDDSIETGGPCYGIASDGERFLYVCLAKPPRVKVFDHEGDALNTFKTDKYGIDLFVSPRYLALDPARNRIYVTDRHDDTLTCLGKQGEVVKVYEDEDLERPYGVAVDGSGIIYICCRRTNTLLCLNSEFQQINDIDDDKWLCKAESVAAWNKQDRLYIGCYLNDDMSVIDLQKLYKE